MDWKFACADFTFPLLAHDQVLDLISMLSFDGIDIGLFENRSHLQPSAVLKDLPASAHRLRRGLSDRGLEPADIFLQTALDFESTAINSPDASTRQAQRETFRRTLEFTVEAGGRHMSGLPGAHFAGESWEDSYRRTRDELAWRCARAREAGITFSVEAHLGSIVPTPEQALKLVTETPELTLTLDYTHFTKVGIPDSRVEPLLKYASHFHARGAAKERLQTPVSENTIDYKRIVSVMEKVGYKGFIGIEYTWTEWEDCNRVDNLSETILLRNLMREV